VYEALSDSPDKESLEADMDCVEHGSYKLAMTEMIDLDTDEVLDEQNI
jgi:hypothetical protein